MRAPTTSLANQITGLSYIFAILLVAVLGSFGWWAASRIDGRSIARETRSVHNELTELAERIPVEQNSSVIWDDAVINLRSNNTSWIKDNLAEWMSSHFDHDQIFLFDASNKVVRATERGGEMRKDVYERELPALLPLVVSLRAQMAQASAGLDDSTEAITGLGILEYLRLGSGAAAVVSVRPIVPDTNAVRQTPGTEYVMISTRLLNGALLSEMRKRTELWDLSFEETLATEGDRLGTPILAKNGSIIGFFNWAPEKPASSFIKETAPVLAAGILAAIIAVTFLLRRLQRTSNLLEDTKEKASFLAFHDPLTSIPNRALFEDRLEQALANMRRTGSMIALHYIDLDRFKHVNDTLGHQAGDELIRYGAQRLAGLVDEVDTVARLGGDEFAIIQFQPPNVASAEALSQKVVDVFADPVPIAGVEASVGASVGVIVTANPSVSAVDLMRQADIALYEAKSSGRGRYQLFAGELDDAVQERRMLEIDLRAALATGQGLQLVYQPVFHTVGGGLAGAEALIRWNHPTRGRMAPDAFIGLAEERGLIDQLGLWVMRSACSFASGTTLPWVAVNVSPLQFRNERFADSVRAILKEIGFPAARLQIEITEGLLLQNSHLIQTTLRELRADGIQIALDDFGTGYSSISYLRTHGIDKLKIDQSFTALLGTDPQIESIIKSIVDLGRAMDMVVTAEGVETTDQQKTLTQIGCDELQGYLLSRPISADQIIAMLGKRQSAAAESKSSRIEG
ncbi:putative bifunctional diguanylate cyclase/phosphodiesterase [Oryzicola mucosus]|uniref:Bifunctional diguanylate cyclase/phosphodiesterase n=1 Tax=Oryzicola mucosus TaxID=2767425 RepID=A0A8J6PME1_9HYPH|nr:bifunctional diguanylate cyclase/phosphodiesterase [Oryzicola mucosus]MBD0413910.1 bifunctional diguanylate cyclase/phosphodiesterase [Oryzicola mucosus]